MTTARDKNHHSKRLFLSLFWAEAGLLFASMYLGLWLQDTAGGAADAAPPWTKALLFTAVTLLSMLATGLYNRHLRDGLEGVVVRVVLSLLLATAGLALLFYLLPGLLLGRGAFSIGVGFAFVSLLVSRLVFRRLLRRGELERRVLVLGAGRHAAELRRLRRRSDLMGFRIVGYVPTPGDEPAVEEELLVRLEGSLCDLAEQEAVEEIIVAVDDRRRGLPTEELLACRTRGVEVVDLVTFMEHELGKIRIDILYPSWLVFADGFERGRIRNAVKRGFDVAVSLLLLLIAAPLMLIAAVAILIEDGRPLLYSQIRVGENGRDFRVYKFRSMRKDAEGDGKAQWARSNDDRITRVGRFIRKYRVDELPQIYNVLRGDMSFVGPRPERPEFVGRLSEDIPYYIERHRVKPGLTGWAQISYPYGASDKDAFEKLQYDLFYVKNHSLLLDLAILMQTAEVVLWGKGAR